MPRPRILWFLLVLVLVQPVVAQTDKTDDFIRSELKRQNIPGLSLAVSKDGKIIKAAGYGVASLKLNTRVRKPSVNILHLIPNQARSASFSNLSQYHVQQMADGHLCEYKIVEDCLCLILL
jgi:hypothetical protein